jgi:hypothetical protein
MRSVVSGLFLAVLSTAVLAQSQIVTLDDLQGVTIHTTNSFVGRFRNVKGEFNGGVTWKMEIKIGPGAAVKWVSTRDRWADGPRAKTAQLVQSGAKTIGVAGAAKDGSSAGLWLLEGGTLTFLRVLETGAATWKITFKKRASGLTCFSVAAVAQEVGAGPAKHKARMEILSLRPTSSSCRASKN